MKALFSKVESKKSILKRNATSFQRGRIKTGGRKRGVPNKRTIVRKVIHDILIELINGELKINVSEEFIQKIYCDLMKFGLKHRDPSVRLSVALELFPYLQISSE